MQGDIFPIPYIHQIEECSTLMSSQPEEVPHFYACMSGGHLGGRRWRRWRWDRWRADAFQASSRRGESGCGHAQPIHLAVLCAGRMCER